MFYVLLPKCIDIFFNVRTLYNCALLLFLFSCSKEYTGCDRYLELGHIEN